MTRAELDALDIMLSAREETWAVGHPVPREDCSRCGMRDYNHANIYEVHHQTDITAPHSHINEHDARLIVALRNHGRELIELARQGLKCECP